jgi:hypothetical protein
MGRLKSNPNTRTPFARREAISSATSAVPVARSRNRSFGVGAIVSTDTFRQVRSNPRLSSLLRKSYLGATRPNIVWICRENSALFSTTGFREGSPAKSDFPSIFNYFYFSIVPIS